MKTTIDIAPALMARCKRLAREQHVTFRSLVEQGLERVMEERGRQKRFKLRAVRFGGGGFQPGFEDAGWDRIRDEIYGGRGA